MLLWLLLSTYLFFAEAMSEAAPIAGAGDDCSLVNQDSTDYNLRIAALFAILGASTIGGCLPLITRRAKLGKPEPKICPFGSNQLCHLVVLFLLLLEIRCWMGIMIIRSMLSSISSCKNQHVAWVRAILLASHHIPHNNQPFPNNPSFIPILHYFCRLTLLLWDCLCWRSRHGHWLCAHPARCGG